MADEIKRSITVQVRLTLAELTIIDRLARGSGQTRSEYLRQCAIPQEERSK